MLTLIGKAKRVHRAGFIVAVTFLLLTSVGAAMPEDFQDQVAAKKLGTWIGIDTYVNFYDYGLQPNSSKFIAAPVAITVYGSGQNSYFIEAGPIKSCYAGQDCQLHPYFSSAVAGVGQFNIDTTRFLADGGLYEYKVDKIGPTVFEALFCSGGSCAHLVYEDMLRTDFPYLFTAVEKTGGARWWPPVTISSAKGKLSNNTWPNWCYDSTNTTIPALTVTPCSNYSWQFHGEYKAFVPLAMNDYYNSPE